MGGRGCTGEAQALPPRLWRGSGTGRFSIAVIGRTEKTSTNTAEISIPKYLGLKIEINLTRKVKAPRLFFLSHFKKGWSLVPVFPWEAEDGDAVQGLSTV